MKWKLGIWFLLTLMPLYALAQDEFDTRDYKWMETLIDSIESSDLCISCDIPPSINVYYTRGYYSPPRTLRFRLYYACDKQSSVTKYFEKDGSIAGVCLVDSTSRDCMDDITALTYTFGLDIETIWSCDFGLSCRSAPRSLLFPSYEVEVSSDLCDGESRVLQTSSQFVTYHWLGPENFESHEEMVKISAAGLYHSIVQNELGCYDTVSIEVDLDAVPMSSISGPEIICDSEAICLSAEGYASYLWSTGETSSSICINEPGRYTVQISNEAGCIQEVETIIKDGRDYGITLQAPEVPIYTGQYVQMNYQLQGLRDEDIVELTWIIDDQRYSELDPIVFKVDRETSIILELESLTGCIYSDQIWIDPLPVNKEVYFANAFNPFSKNGNDRFYPQVVLGTIEVKDFAIFDRWGNEVYYSSDGSAAHQGHGWNGQFNDQLLPTGTYLYMAELTYADGSSEMKSGTVLLIY